jgi:hypothetical protein
VLDPIQFLRAAEHGGGLFLALQLTGSVRTELEQLVSLLEAGISEAEEARALDCPARVRAMNIGRTACELATINARKLGLVEAQLMARHRAPPLPLVEAPSLDALRAALSPGEWRRPAPPAPQRSWPG